MGLLKVTAGPSFSDLAPVQVNRFPLPINNDLFEGILIVRINGFDESTLPPPPSHIPHNMALHAEEYFKDRSRQFSFQVEGRFKQKVNGDDLFWDISFPYPLQGLPFFTPMVVKGLQYLDPATEVDFYAKEQYVRSSVLTMMNSINAWKPAGLTTDEQAVIDEDLLSPSSATASRTSMAGDDDDAHSDAGSIASTNGLPAPPSVITRNGSSERILHPETLQNGVQEDMALIISSMRRASISAGEPISPTSGKTKLEPPRSDVAKRRKFFLSAENRKLVDFSPDVIYGFESFNPNMCFTDFTAKLPGLSIDVKKYFPVKRILRVRMCSKDGKTTYFGMEIELLSNDGSAWSLATDCAGGSSNGSSKKGSRESLKST
ncbi:hypothetical protein HDU86_006879 [Geranomyces michiganensis]|nr:hypothetical protein HDU86_006879 [Geranomyces michiganensis]